MRRELGFTLIELMIVVVVVAILAALALPSYNEYVRKGRRADAARFVGQIQLELERWRSENPSYANCTPSPCGSGTYPSIPATDASPYYTISIVSPSASGYSVTATPRPGSAQAGDRCGVLTVNPAVKGGKPQWANAACNN
jgi:type IV pilus assembly protein PilE